MERTIDEAVGEALERLVQKVWIAITTLQPQARTDVMNIEACFPARYVRASDLQNQDVTVVISRVVMEQIDDDNGEMKPVIYFQPPHRRGMCLNKTNALVISSLYGSETEHWVNRPITLYPDKVQFGGKLVDAIRVRPFPPQHAQPAFHQPAFSQQPPPFAQPQPQVFGQPFAQPPQQHVDSYPHVAQQPFGPPPPAGQQGTFFEAQQPQQPQPQQQHAAGEVRF